jgi:hypothetical protein
MANRAAPVAARAMGPAKVATAEEASLAPAMAVTAKESAESAATARW